MGKIYVVTECGTACGNGFSNQIGVYSTLEKAQKRMTDCFEQTKVILNNSQHKIISYEVDSHETTLLYEKLGNVARHFVVIDERIIDEDGDDFLCKFGAIDAV